MDIHSLYKVFLPYFRGKRLRLFNTLLSPTPKDRMLDVGGYPWVWEGKGFPGKILLSNLTFPGEIASAFPKDPMVIADGMRLPFGDRSVDIVFSNSVIEHLHSFENQKRFAAELSRVGRRLWVQTPARWFWVEPHLMTPFVHYLPKSIQRYLLRYLSVWGLVKKPSQAEVDAFLAEVRLLSYAEMCQLYPDCRIVRERVLGFTKSYIAVRLV